MTFRVFVILFVAAMTLNAGGCGGGGTATAPSPEPTATQPLAVVPPVVTPNPITLTQPTPAAPGSQAPVTPATPAPATPGVVSPSGTVTSTNSCGLVSFQADVMRAVNAARAQARSCASEAKPAVTPLGWNNTLFAIAAAHSQDMAQRNYFSHTSPEGKTSGDRALLAGYRFSALGENIAAGQTGVDIVMAGWLASEGHCRNIMNAVFTEIAVACVATSRPMYPTYWTMVLGKPQ